MSGFLKYDLVCEDKAFPYYYFMSEIDKLESLKQLLDMVNKPEQLAGIELWNSSGSHARNPWRFAGHPFIDYLDWRIGFSYIFYGFVFLRVVKLQNLLPGVVWLTRLAVHMGKRYLDRDEGFIRIMIKRVDAAILEYENSVLTNR